MTADKKIYCNRCGEKLDEEKAVWLDLNVNTGEYRAEAWPETESQGGFSFGSACAKAVLKNAGHCVRIGVAKQRRGDGAVS